MYYVQNITVVWYVLSYIYTDTDTRIHKGCQFHIQSLRNNKYSYVVISPCFNWRTYIKSSSHIVNPVFSKNSINLKLCLWPNIWQECITKNVGFYTKNISPCTTSITVLAKIH